MTNPLNVANSKQTSSMSLVAFFEFAFRPFFLFGSLFSIFGLIIWNTVLQGDININVYGGALWWHIHEMLFAFVAAIIIGFLLTAVQNWTGIRSVHGGKLMVLFAIWLLARIAFWLPNIFSVWLIAGLDIVFLPLAAAALAYPIIKVKLWRNLMFIPILLLMTVCNVLMHYSVFSQNPTLLATASTAMVLVVTLVMCVMGGRVFPMFTANGTQTKRVESLPWLEKTAIISTVLAVICSFDFLPLPAFLSASIFIVSGLAHAIRVFRWNFKVTLKTPLVWPLHLSYWAIAIGLIMFGLAEITTLVSHSQAIHALTVGAMASMILAMISRVSLGHTGRNIVVGKVMTLAFAAIFLAFVIRVFGSYFIGNYNHMISLAVMLWVIAYGSFVALYLPILTTPKV